MNLDFYIKMRFRVIIYLMLALVATLIVRLYFLQVMSGSLYAQEASQSIVRTETVPAPRGNIYDRNGKLLVKSVPSPAVAVDPSIVADNEEVLEILSEKLRIPYDEIAEKVKKSNISYLERVILKQDVDYETMIYIKENANSLPGVEIINVFFREYQYGSLAAHVLGYIGEIDEEKLKSEEYSVEYEGGDQIGLTGIEEFYEDVLKGTKGKITYEVDPLGRPKTIVDEVSYTAGNDIYVTIDIDLQKVVEELLSSSILAIRETKVSKSEEFFKAPGGAIVVLSAQTGEILAMASYPTYDPSVFTGGISVSDWNYLNDPANQYPLNNRAVMSFASGSVFKVVTAYAGLCEEVITENSYESCGGVWYGLGKDYPKYCASKGGHGSLSIVNAIKYSCDIYFYNVGYKLYMKNNNVDELLQKYASTFGFGNKTGVDLPYEDSGLVPDREWKEEFFEGLENSIWFPGDTVNMSIGQGDVLSTPLQMAQAYSIIVNRGLKYTPHFLKEVKDAEGNTYLDAEANYEDLNLNKEYLDMIEKGLGLVVTGGTAASRFLGFPLDEIPVAAKTGTAEVLGKQDYGWFATYAPIGNPEYIIVGMIEQGGYGSNSVAPIAEKIYEYLFNVDSR